MISFETGVEALKRFIGRSGDEACCADETDVLHAAFRVKATVHAGPIGLPMLFGAARPKLEALSHETRTKEAVACVHAPFCCAEVLLFSPFGREVLFRPTSCGRSGEELVRRTTCRCEQNCA